MIVDCHTHWGTSFAERDGDDLSHWLEVLDRHQVDRACTFGHASLVRSDLCAADNDRLARLRDRAPGRILPFGTAWPQMGAEAVAEARRCLESLGLLGLKFHPWLQGFSTADPVMDDLLELAADWDAPVVFHDGTPCYSLPEQIGGLARRHPRTRIILGHSGILSNWRSALAAGRLPNVWLTLCGPHQRAMEIICQQADGRRLLGGSDFGFGFIDCLAYRLGLIQTARIDEATRARILGANPLQVIGRGKRGSAHDG